MSKKPAPRDTTTPTPAPVDPAAAKKAFEALAPGREALSKDRLALVNLDVQEAAIIALAVSRFLAGAEPRARFGLLHERLFDPAHVVDLEPRALAASYAFVELQAARAQTTEARLPVALVEASSRVKERMLECGEYLFKRHPTLSKEMASIRIGTGYTDTASDLVRLARVYEDHRSTVERDPLNYRDTDAADARRYAHEILTELGKAQSAEEQRCVASLARAFTMLRDTYGHVRAAGQFLYRAEGPEEKFPSLYAGSGGGRPKKAAPPPATPSAPVGAPADGA